MSRATIAAALTCAALGLLAGCGGDGPGSDQAMAPPKPGLSGEQLFQQTGCAGCHRLSQAGAVGHVGPSLDGKKLSVDTVARTVQAGRGRMPSYDDQLTDAEIRRVAEYVSRASGG